MKILRYSILGILAVLILIQFIPRSKPNRTGNESLRKENLIKAPDQISAILKSSCFDCHSYETNFPWYADVAPSSWLIDQHINNGMEELNFSEWNTLSKRKKISLLSDIAETIENGEMPLKSYLLLHNEARMSPDEKEILISWTESETKELLNQ